MIKATVGTTKQAVRGADIGMLSRSGPMQMAVSRQRSFGEGCQLPVGAHSYSIRPYNPPGARTNHIRVS